MRNVYTWAANPAKRNVTLADLQAGKGKRKFTQVTANTAEEAHAAGVAGFDMIIGNYANVEVVREGNNELFLTAALVLQDFVTVDDLMRGAFDALAKGADAVMTARSPQVVEALAREEVPVMCHLGLVPRKSTWVGGLRAIGKTAGEAYALFQKFKRYEDAGAVLVEAEVIPGPVMTEISKRSSLITVSLGSGGGGDVDYLFMNDICGEQPTAPRHARAYGNLHALYEQIKEERIQALKAFREDCLSGQFPGEAETPKIKEEEFEGFLAKLEG